MILIQASRDGVPPESETRKIRDSSLQENGCPSPNRHPVFSAERSSSVSSAGCWRARNVSALGRELKLMRKDLYVLRDRFLSGGPQALRGRGAPRKREGAARGAPIHPRPLEDASAPEASLS